MDRQHSSNSFENDNKGDHDALSISLNDIILVDDKAENGQSRVPHGQNNPVTSGSSSKEIVTEKQQDERRTEAHHGIVKDKSKNLSDESNKKKSGVGGLVVGYICSREQCSRVATMQCSICRHEELNIEGNLLRSPPLRTV